MTQPQRLRDPARLPGAIQFDMESRAASRAYRIFVAVPPVPPPASGYPLLVTTDGNMTFPIAAAMGALFALGGEPALVVGVGYPAENPLELTRLRFRDLTAPTPQPGFFRSPVSPGSDPRTLAAPRPSRAFSSRSCAPPSPRTGPSMRRWRRSMVTRWPGSSA
ncbi:MAG TPA: hypothetical protein VMU93_14085 [Caulobacteraceae bacterium]|nr:hypothetical protein [Caulobacteraceae bacterium]